MGDVNTELHGRINGKKIINRQPVYIWETCTAEQFIDRWLPLFEAGTMRPEDAPVAATLMQVSEEQEED